MQPHQERVVNEKRELDEKLAKLKAFCFGESNAIFRGLHPIDRNLLEDQFTVMERYSSILDSRIKRFLPTTDSAVSEHTEIRSQKQITNGE